MAAPSATPFADAAEEVKVDTEETEEQKEARLKAEHFANWKERFKDAAPTEEQMNDWKAQAGRVRWLDIGETELYVFRPFRTAEYRGLVESLAELAQSNAERADERLRDQVIQRCILFPKLQAEEMGTLYGGTLETLYFQIRLASNFIPPDQATMMVREW